MIKEHKGKKNDASLVISKNPLGIGLIIDFNPPFKRTKKRFAIRIDLIFIRFYWANYLERKPIGSVKMKNGHKMFEFNIRTKEMNEAQYIDGRNGKRKKLLMKKDCLYEPAVNKKNAARKILKRLK